MEAMTMRDKERDQVFSDAVAIGAAIFAERLKARGFPALIRPSAVTSEGWYWAEEVLDGGDDYRLVVLRAESVLDGRDLRFELDGSTYDRAAADRCFRVIGRIEEPAGPQGGWAEAQPCVVCQGAGRLMWSCAVNQGVCRACGGAGVQGVRRG